MGQPIVILYLERRLMPPWIQRFRFEPRKKREINYLYFISLTLFLCGLIVALFSGKGKSLIGPPLYFLVHALGQVLLEVCLFMALALLLKRWAPRWVFFLFLALSFIALLLHYTHFVLVRLMDASLRYLFQFLFGSGIDHLIAAFQALNMNPTIIALIAVALFLLPLVGPTFYWLTQQIVRLKPFRLSFFQIGTVFCSIFAFLLLFDLAAYSFVPTHFYAKYEKTLPLGTTFLTPDPKALPLQAPLPQVPEEETLFHSLAPLPSLEKKPNLFFFVIETLRKDFVTRETAPHLLQFAQTSFAPAASFSNANSTHLSWFALFHAQYPFHWTNVRDEWEKGSIPLRALKELGYQVHIYSSADLHFYQMDQILFGKNRNLIDSLTEYASHKDLKPCERDLRILSSFEKKMQEHPLQEGNAFFFFLDSTHSEYSFPEDFPLAFEPIVKEISYLTLHAQKEELEYLKNRYRNAIRYVDHLMGRFFQTLQKYQLFDSSIIAIAADHGEEFFEEGALFHGTHLNAYQTHVPIYLKFPPSPWTPATDEIQHIDLFPSILHYLTGSAPTCFAGQSIFLPRSWPYHLTVTQNGGDTPYEFCLEKDGVRLHVRFADPEKIYQATQVELIQGSFSLEEEPPPFIQALIPLTKR